MAAKRAAQSILPKSQPPSWTPSKRISEFIAHVSPVTCPSQASSYVNSLLESDKRIRNATHNITAWRIRGDGTGHQQFNDDGETGAGSRLLQLMQSMDLWDSMVVVTRWYGGVHLGSKRFRLITAVASDAFARAGMAGDKKEEGSKGKKKK
ncbi:ribosomal protein S5 domain 2-type protein [Fusarium flagelliforme]|uniref:ribosomal protein S5 domain 2-type protein n=1 Tax=Fusarium flagelliforme TaxID=2675880 RepID=UPI001E8D8741|nr:ribosomal protein S5 domain 2-type protein [Fusarium flagelliforme]KAH7192026.1 ribosomal protein S5 domain 2-type protein [Fusarium flagelliforme]